MRFRLPRANTRQGGVVDMSVSAPAASGGIDAEGAIPSVDVNLPSTSVSLDAPGERLLQFGVRLLQQIVFGFRPVPTLWCLGFALYACRLVLSWGAGNTLRVGRVSLSESVCPVFLRFILLKF